MPRVTTLPPYITCRRVKYLSADRARRCLTRNEVGRVNHITRKASFLAMVLISLICQITPFSGKLRPKASAWVPLNTRATSPTIDNLVHCTSGQPSPLHLYHSTPTRPVTQMPRITALPPNITCRRVTHPSADRARRCLTSERSRASQTHHYKR